MSEPSITSIVKEKDPRRVEAGKRLGAISKQAKGAISKQAKEAKRLERQAQAEMGVSDNSYVLYFIGGLVAVGAASYLYLNKNDSKKLPTIPESSQPKRNSRRVFSN